jgi:parallel beta-helix repeat protein
MPTNRPLPLQRLLLLAPLVALVGCLDPDPAAPPDPGNHPPAEPESCADGELWDLLLERCVPERCGSGRYPVPKDPDKATIHVDPAFQGGSNGTALNPYRDVLEAAWQAGPDTAILMAAGTAEVDGFVELSGSGQELLGRCPELSVLRAAGSPRLVRIGQTAQVRVAGLTLEGGPPNQVDTPGEPLLEMFNSSQVALSDLTVRGASHDGILIWQCEDVEVQRVRVEDSVRAGISMSLTSRGTLRDNHVATTARDANGELGVGIWVEHGVAPVVIRNRVEGNGGPGVIVTDTASARITDNHVVDNGSAGIWSEYDDDLRIDDNVVVSNVGVGVAFRASGGTVTGNTITDTRCGEDGHGGRGLDVRDAGPVAAERNVLERNREVGLLFHLSDGTVRDNEVRDNTASDASRGGRGMEIRDVANVQVTGNLVQHCEEAGIVVIEATGTLDGNEVRDTLAARTAVDGYDFGHGIHVQSSTDVVSSNNVIVSSRHAGVVYLHTLRGIILDNVVEDTAGAEGGLWPYADGVVAIAVDDEITLTGNDIRGSERCGVLVDGGTTAWLEGNSISGNGRAVVGQQGAILELGDNEIEGNDDDTIEQVEGPLLPLYEEFLPPIGGD